MLLKQWKKKNTMRTIRLSYENVGIVQNFHYKEADRNALVQDDKDKSVLMLVKGKNHKNTVGVQLNDKDNKEKSICKTSCKERMSHTISRKTRKDSYPNNEQTLSDIDYDVYAKSNNGKTKLIAAVNSGDLTLTKALLDKCVDVNAKDKNGMTALIHAVLKSYSGNIQTLLDSGANVNAKDIDGKTALIHVGQYHCLDNGCSEKTL
jgi:ankyrin repeat protein